MNVLLKFLLMFFLMACDAEYQIDDAPIQASQCLAEPPSPIVQSEIGGSTSLGAEAKYTVNRSANGDLTVRHLENDCFVSLFLIGGQSLEIREGSVRRFVEQSDQYVDVVIPARDRFIRMCERTSRFDSERRSLRSASIDAGEVQLPCETILDRYSLNLVLQVSEDAGPIGGVSFIDGDFYLWRIK